MPGAGITLEFLSGVEENTFGIDELIQYVPPYGYGATYGVYDGANQDSITNLTDPQFWISEVTLGNQGHTGPYTQLY